MQAQTMTATDRFVLLWLILLRTGIEEVGLKSISIVVDSICEMIPMHIEKSGRPRERLCEFVWLGPAF